MYKYYAIDSGEEVKVGDTMVLKVSDYPVSFEMKIQEEEDLEILFKYDALTKKEEKTKRQNKPVSITYERVIERIADRIGWKQEKVQGYLNNLITINPSAALTVVMDELARECDRNYPDHISEVKVLWVWDKAAKSPRLYTGDKRLNLKVISAFRTMTDLADSLKVCEPILKQIYGGK